MHLTSYTSDFRIIQLHNTQNLMLIFCAFRVFSFTVIIWTLQSTPFLSPISFSLLSPLSRRHKTSPVGDDESYKRTSSCIHINKAARGALREILGCHNSTAADPGLHGFYVILLRVVGIIKVCSVFIPHHSSNILTPSFLPSSPTPCPFYIHVVAAVVLSLS